MSIAPIPDFSTMTHTTIPESSWLEYKQELPNQTQGTRKMVETICAFLNTGGGHMVFGVRDLDGYLVGVPTSGKTFDRFLLSIDTIFHGRLIIDEAEPERGLPPSCMRTTIVPTGNKDAKLFVITVTRPSTTDATERGMETDEPTRYSCHGTVWHRLNASNYREKAEDLHQLTVALRKERDVLASSLKQLRKEFGHVVKVAKTMDLQIQQFQSETVGAMSEAEKGELWMTRKEKEAMTALLLLRSSAAGTDWFCCG